RARAKKGGPGVEGGCEAGHSDGTRIECQSLPARSGRRKHSGPGAHDPLRGVRSDNRTARRSNSVSRMKARSDEGVCARSLLCAPIHDIEVTDTNSKVPAFCLTDGEQTSRKEPPSELGRRTLRSRSLSGWSTVVQTHRGQPLRFL